MDEAVRRAMARWPDVPAVFGWLSLDMRGRWLIRGEPITHPLLIEFIGRNYAADEHGRWFFQNGPQRVFVALAYAPWVLRLDAHGSLTTHTGLPVPALAGAWMDRQGVLLLQTAHGAGVVDDKDAEALARGICDASGTALDDAALEAALEALEQGTDAGLQLRYGSEQVAFRPIRYEEAAERLRFVREPQPLPHERSAR